MRCTLTKMYVSNSIPQSNNALGMRPPTRLTAHQQRTGDKQARTHRVQTHQISTIGYVWDSGRLKSPWATPGNLKYIVFTNFPGILLQSYTARVSYSPGVQETCFKPYDVCPTRVTHYQG